VTGEILYVITLILNRGKRVGMCIIVTYNFYEYKFMFPTNLTIWIKDM
jgi:hypothetical protein